MGAGFSIDDLQIDVASYFLTIAISLIAIPAVTMAIIGLKKGKPWFLIPRIAVCALDIVVVVNDLWLLQYVITGTSDTETSSEMETYDFAETLEYVMPSSDTETSDFVELFFTLIFVVPLTILDFYAAVKSYRYLRAKQQWCEKFLAANPTSMEMGAAINQLRIIVRSASI